LISRENLPFTLVESEAFKELLILCNPSVKNILFHADTLTEHVMRTYIEAKNTIKVMLLKFSSKINLTCDLWTSPNAKSLLGVTCHWTDEKFDLKELVLHIVEIKKVTREKISRN